MEGKRGWRGRGSRAGKMVREKGRSGAVMMRFGGKNSNNMNNLPKETFISDHQRGREREMETDLVEYLLLSVLVVFAV